MGLPEALGFAHTNTLTQLPEALGFAHTNTYPAAGGAGFRSYKHLPSCRRRWVSLIQTLTQLPEALGFAHTNTLPQLPEALGSAHTNSYPAAGGAGFRS